MIYLKKDFLRDIIALASPTFYVLVFVRAIVGGFLPFIYRLLIAAPLILILNYLVSFTLKKNPNLNVSLGILIGFFVSDYYKNPLFSAMMIIVGVILIYAIKKIQKEKNENIFLGLLTGVITTIITILIIPEAKD